MASVGNFISDNASLFSHSIRAFLPKRAVVPVVQTTSEKQDAFALQVAVGERVAEGQLLANSIYDAIHAPIPGIVEKIESCEFPNGMLGNAITIALSGAFSYTGKVLEQTDWKAVHPHLIGDMLHGVVNTFVGSKSLAFQLRTLPQQSERLIVLRLFDNDPSRVVECFLSAHEAAHIGEGIAIIAKVLQARGIIVAYGAKNAAALSDIKASIGQHTDVAVNAVKIDDSAYPAGFCDTLIAAIKEQCAGEPWTGVSVRDLFIDVQTALRVYEAVVLKTPVIDSYVHVTGSCLPTAAILRVKVGTTIGEIAAQCGGFISEPARVVVNGIITGTAVNSMQIPVTKYVKSITFQTNAQVELYYAEPCIRCGNCRLVCPNKLVPDMMYRAFVHGEYAAEREKRTALIANLCSHCGLCNAVCPARLPLTQAIALL